MATGLENLKIYALAKELELRTQKLLSQFPTVEKFRSVDQISRSSSSVSNNIAESYYKKYGENKFYILRDIVIGEIEETRTNLTRCFEKGFCGVEAQKISNEYINLRRAVFGYIKFLKDKTHQLKQKSAD